MLILDRWVERWNTLSFNLESIWRRTMLNWILSHTSLNWVIAAFLFFCVPPDEGDPPAVTKWVWQWKVLIDGPLRTLFIAPLYLSSCPFLYLRAQLLSRYGPPLLGLQCQRAVLPSPSPSQSPLQTQVTNPASSPRSHRSGGGVKIGRLTSREGNGRVAYGGRCVCVVSERCDPLRVCMLCLALPFGLWWPLRNGLLLLLLKLFIGGGSNESRARHSEAVCCAPSPSVSKRAFSFV